LERLGFSSIGASFEVSIVASFSSQAELWMGWRLESLIKMFGKEKGQVLRASASVFEWCTTSYEAAGAQ
jgi:hypothetical protein